MRREMKQNLAKAKLGPNSIDILFEALIHSRKEKYHGLQSGKKLGKMQLYLRALLQKRDLL